ncbi:MAG: T9SS type A sorting domain-containing protein [Ginsengibacter sp.]
MNKKLLSIFFSVLFLVFGLQASSQPYKRICVIGSSTAWGYFGSANPAAGMYPRDSAWTFKLSNYYQARGEIDTLFNIASVGTDPYTGMPSSYVPPPGHNAPDGRYNITKAINFVPRPDVIIVNYPSNNFDWQTPQEILFCLQTIKDSANAAGIECYITTTQPRNNFSTSERQKLQDLRDLIINRFGQYAIDFFTPIVEVPTLNILPQYSLGDGIHTNPAGQTVLEQQVIAKDILLSTLAINFLSVTGANENARARITWSIAPDQNLKEFAIEKSGNGKDFYEVGKVNPKSSASQQHYMFVDNGPVASVNYYRVVAFETGNHKIFSRVVVIIQPGKSFHVEKIFPVPAKDQINVKVFSASPEKITFSIADANGRVLRRETKMVQTQFTYIASVASLPAGRYTLTVQANLQEETLKFIK